MGKKMDKNPSESDDVKAAVFEEIDNPFEERKSMASDDELNMDVLLDVPVTLSMELGRTQINIRNLLQLTQGSVVELDRYAGEPLDILVNGTLIAHGEVVVINDKFGIRITDVISLSERVKRLA
jgi:flagellar motor switch protein FliN/FliY